MLKTTGFDYTLRVTKTKLFSFRADDELLGLIARASKISLEV